MATEDFTVTYDGPALEGGSMEVRDLAPALLALSDAIREVSTIAEPTQPAPTLSIRATNHGSFTVHLAVSDPSLIDQAADLLTGRQAVAAVNLTELLGFVFLALVGLRNLARRVFRRAEPSEDGRTITIHYTDNTTFVVPSESWRAMQVRPFRRAAREVVRPVKTEGIDEVRFEHPVLAEPLRVTDSELPGFETPLEEDEELLLDDIFEMTLHPVTIAFTEGNKWRVSDGDQIFPVKVADENFLARVDENEPFSKGDIFRCQVHVRQWRADDGSLKIERTIVQVFRHFRGPQQTSIPMLRLPTEEVPPEDTDDGPRMLEP